MELVNLIYSGTRAPDRTLADQLIRLGFSFEEITEFGSDLKLSALPSIDAFLEHRGNYREMGKAAIAAMLLPLENRWEFEANDEAGNNHWYDYLIRAAGDMRSIGKRNLLSILTFNYDRSLDHFFFMHFRKAYGMKEDVAAQYASMIPIIHLYGKLGELPHKDPENGLPYEGRVNSEIIKKSAKNIMILCEGTNACASVEFQRGIDILGSVQIICFLGFGYHEENVARLNIHEVASRQALFGSGYGITPEERQPILRMFKDRLDMGIGAHDALAYLRNSPVLHRL
jgi:hypothetical protein